MGANETGLKQIIRFLEEEIYPVLPYKREVSATAVIDG